MFTLAHVSDWHTTTLAGAGVGDFLSKRVLGWLSWSLRRSQTHRPEVLAALFDDLRAAAPDHVAVTGDLTNVSLEQEFIEAARWLERLGPPERVSLVPGNHDVYVAVPAERSWDLWAPYLVSDPDPVGRAVDLTELEKAARAPRHDEFPTLRVRGEVALVGVCSAVPTPWFVAAGRVGGAQCERLAAALRGLRERGLCRVVLIHHPPTDDGMSARRRLRDSAALRAVLEREGADLVLHGHRHRTAVAELAGPEGPIPVLGVRSSSDCGLHEHKRAHYHLHEIEGSGRRFRVRTRVRGYDPATRCFRDEGELALK